MNVAIMCVQNLKFVALPVLEIKGGTLKVWAFPGYAYALFSPKFLRGYYSNVPAKFEVRNFTGS